MNWKSKILLLGLLCSLPATRASAAFCLKCPTDGTGASFIGGSLIIFVGQGADRYFLNNGATVGACNVLEIVSDVQYQTFGGPNHGFTGGTGLLYIVQRGAAFVHELVADVTPSDMDI